MRILLSLFILFAFSLNCLADEWDDYIKIDTDAKNQQRSVTQDEFEKVMQRYEKKKKDKDKPKVKGKALAPESEDFGNVQIFKDLYETYPTIMVPTDLVTYQGEEIPAGFYRIMSVKKPEGFYMNFYQGNSLVAHIFSHNTGNDYKQKTLNYASIIPKDEKTVRFIYGDIDCNLETVLLIKNAI